MKSVKFFLLLISIPAVLWSCSSARNTATDPLVENLIHNQRFVFAAQSVNPREDSRYNPRLMFPNAANNLYQLSPGYDLRVTRDSVIAYLPFFGRAYTAPINPSEGGIKFTSTNFSYKLTTKKGNYHIEIHPKDNREVNYLYLTVSPSGYSTLQVMPTNKSPISYYGRLQKINDNN